MSTDSVSDAPVVALEAFAVGDVTAVIAAFRDALVAHKDRINVLNVYPVPDGDTGTNMSLTLSSVVDELRDAGPSMTEVMKAISHGSLMGARGNSGVILSQILRGVAGVVADHDEIDAPLLAHALSAATTAAYGAVMRPVEGTILTVIREIADESEKAVADGAGLIEMLDRAHAAGTDSLARTPELLQALADAGVVDAGGAGLLLLIDAMLTVADGRPLPEPPLTVGPVTGGHGDHAHDHGGDEVSELRYEVMYFLEAADESVDGFMQVWAGIGDSIVVVGGDGLWNCHIHCDDIGAAIEAGIEIGRPSQIRVTDLVEQVDHLESVDTPDLVPGVALNTSADVTTAVVAVAVGDGVRRIFESLGVQAVVTGGQTMNPSTELLLQAVEQVSADEVVILPNNKNIIAVAEQVDGATDKSVGVVPTRGIAEGFAALLAYDPQAGRDDNVESMLSAASAVDAGEIVQAVRDSKSEAGDIRAGEWMAITRAGITAVAPTMVEATCAMLEGLVGDEHEIVTLIRGVDADDDTTEKVVAWLETNHPDIEVEVHDGGQPMYPFYVGVE
ncbi:MAG: DAK2 domain-containing protein [Acidimicrobiia bacterium]|nr:DAK2 domain-containing protein [Acidimicrobiia bacterium]